MIVGYVQNGLIEEVHEVFGKILEHNVVSWITLVVGYSQSGSIEYVFQFFGEMPKQDVVSWTTMISR